ncbi:MAG: LpqB family beta-propeller domain-containing protein [bacterium]
MVPASPLRAAKLRRPFNVSIGVNYGYDNYGGAGCDDYQCGGVCYDGHSGTDFPLGFGTTVVAAAAGQVISVYNGCANVGYLGNTCGGRCGNYVQVEHNDGTRTLYCHMRLNSIVVSLWQWVSCGQTLGQSASSGSSTGNHLHLGYRIGGVNRDPFAGACSQATSYWTNQGSYPHPIPGTACETSCACNPGQTQSQSCGDCGTRTRTCNSSCQWGGWSACAGQGACSPGATQSRDCCDCGTEARTCSGSCQWGGWSECAGPDPSGTPACETGEPGVCAAGRMRCQTGCLTCVRDVEPTPELCDDLDNDCNGEVDDGSPATLSDPPPAFAARLVDWSISAVLGPGERAQGWAVFENVGAERWPAHEIVLGALAPLNGAYSALRDEETWPAHDVVTRLTEEVAPGDLAELRFTVRLDESVREAITEGFSLLDPTGVPMRCPAAELTLSLTPDLPGAPTTPGSEEDAAVPTSSSEPPGSATVTGGCRCGSGGEGGSGSGGLAVFLLLGLFWARGRRRRRRCPRIRDAGPALVLLVAFLGRGCERPTTASSGFVAPQVRLAATSRSDSRLAAAQARLPDPEWTVLDAGSDGAAVVGRLLHAPARITARRRYEAHFVTAQGTAIPLPPEIARIQEARFAPDGSGRVAVLDGRDELWVWNPGADARSAVDQHVLPGLSWSPTGDTLAYVGGEVPDLGLYLYDTREGRGWRDTVVEPGAPLSLPAFSPDGARLVFASARGGVPALWLVRRDGTGLRQLTNRGLTPEAFAAGAHGVPMPEGWRPPVWLEHRVVFEAQGAVHAVDAGTGDPLWRVARARRPHLGVTGQAVIVRRDDPGGEWLRVRIDP